MGAHIYACMYDGKLSIDGISSTIKILYAKRENDTIST